MLSFKIENDVIQIFLDEKLKLTLNTEVLKDLDSYYVLDTEAELVNAIIEKLDREDLRLDVTKLIISLKELTQYGRATVLESCTVSKTV